MPVYNIYARSNSLPVACKARSTESSAVMVIELHTGVCKPRFVSVPETLPRSLGCRTEWWPVLRHKTSAWS